MTVKTWIPLIIAIVLGLVAAKLGRDMMSRRPQVDGAKLTPIVVVTGDVAPGHELTADDLAVRKISSDASAVQFSDPAELVGRVVLTELAEGQPVYNSSLAPLGAGSGLQALVPPGKRAFTVDVDEFTGVGGLLVPGCIVDVVSTIQTSGQDGSISRTIVENVRVTAVGKQTGSAEADESKPGEMFKSVTLLVTPQEAEALELAYATGNPRLVLRSNGDNGPAGTTGISLTELSGSAPRTTDPFIPVIQIPIAPATQPAVVEAGPEQFRPQQPTRQAQRRTVTIIRSGVPSNVIFELSPPPQPTSGMMTDNNTDPATQQ